MSFYNIQPSPQSPRVSHLLEINENKKVTFTDEELKQIQQYKEKLQHKVFNTSIQADRFALVLGDTSIMGSKYEGGNVKDAINAWRNLLLMWKKRETEIPLGLEEREIDLLIQDFDSAAGVTGKTGAALYKYVGQELENKKFVALPIRYAGKAGAQAGGHVFGAIFEKDEAGQIRCILVDKGEASGMHPIVAYTGKAKRSYRFFPILLHDNNFFNKDGESVGLEFFNRITQYQQPPTQDERPYSSEEIYNLFLQIGKVEENKKELVDFKEEEGVTPQRSGTCPEMFCRLVLRDLLTRRMTDIGDALVKYRRCIYAEKFNTLHEACQAPLQNIPSMLMKQGTDDFALSVEKHYSEGRIDRAEYLKSYALIELSREKIVRIESNVPSSTTPLPDLNIESPSLLNITIPKAHKVSEGDEDVILPSDNHVNISRPDPKNLLGALRLCLEKSEKDSEPKRAMYTAYHMLNNLPIPGDEEDNYWDKVSQEDIPECLDYLKQLTEFVHQKTRECPVKDKDFDNTHHPMLILLDLSALAIADRLARRDPKLCLDNYCINVSFNGLGSKFFYHLGPDTKRFHQAKAYLNSKKGGKPLFGFKECDNLNKVVESLFTNASQIDTQDRPLRNHLLYLKELLSKLNPEGLDQNNETLKYLQLISTKCRIRRDFNQPEEVFYNKQFLPKAYTALQYFAFQTNSMLSFAPSSKAPSFPTEFVGVALKEEKDSADYKASIQMDKSTISDERYTEKTKQGRFRPTGLNLFGFKEENAVFSQKLPEAKRFPRHVRRSLEKIRLKDNLIIPSLTHWCEENPEYAKSLDVQSYIELFALQDCHLVDKAKQEPLVIDNLRQVIDKKINEGLDPSKLNLALFWLGLAFHIETQLAQAKGCSSKVYYERVSKLQKNLESLKKSILASKEAIMEEKKRTYLHDIAACQAYFASFPFSNESLSLEAVATIISNRTLQTIHSPLTSALPSWFLEEIHSQFYHHSEEIKRQLKDPEILKKALIPIHENLGIDFAPENAPIYTFPNITVKLPEKNIQINLLDGSLRLNGKILKLGKWPHWIKPDDSRVKEALGTKLADITTPTDDLIKAIDGSFLIDYYKHGNEVYILKKMSFNDQEQYYQYCPTPKLPSALFSGNKKCWLSTSASPYFLIINSDGTPYARVNSLGTGKEGKMEVIRLSKPKLFDQVTKKEIIEKLITLPPASDWSKYLAETVPVSSVLVWGKEIGENKTQITRFEFTKFDNLSFTISQEEGKTKRAYCDQLQGYFLSPEQGEKSLDYLPGSLTLERGDGFRKKYVLLPAARLSEKSMIEEKKASHRSGEEEFFFREKHHFLYEIAKDGTFISHSQTAMLYLIYALKKQGNYLEANKYIEQFQHLQYFEKEDQQIIEALLKKDSSPHAAGLSMKVGLLLAENRSLPLRGLPLKGPYFKLELAIPLSEQCESYLKYTANPDLNHVPYYLRVNPKQIKQILKLLTKKGQNLGFTSEITWNLIKSKNALRSIEAQELKEDLRVDFNIHQQMNSLLQKRLKNPDRLYKDLKSAIAMVGTRPQERPLKKIRVSSGDLCKNFLNLLREASACPTAEQTPFDLKLSQLYDQFKDRGNPLLLILILYLARSHPEMFFDFEASIETFGRPSEFRENFLKRVQSVLDQITKKAEGYEHPEFPEKVVTVKTDLGKVSLERFLTNATTTRKGFQISASLATKPLRPLKPILKGYFNKSTEEILKADQKTFALKNQSLQENPQLAQRIKKRLEDGHEASNENKVYIKYDFKPDSSVSDLKKTLGKEMSKKQEALEALKLTIEKLANYPSSEDLAKLSSHELDVIQHKMRIEGKQQPKLAIEDVMIAVLHKDAAALQISNPFLTEEMCAELFHKTIEYELIGSYQDQCQEALNLVIQAQKIDNPTLRKSKLVRAAEIMDKKREYDPYLFPELLFYEYASGLMLRNEPSQAALLKNIFSLIFDQAPTTENRDLLRKLFFEFQAGGGKTKVISAIVAFKAISEGKKPVFFSLPDLFDITKKDLQSAMNRALKRKTRTIEIGLDTKLKSGKLKKFYKGCKRSFGLCDVMKPESFHALHLKYQEALHEKDARKVALLSKILAFYENEGIFLVDESHRNADSLLQSNLAFGMPYSIPAYQRNFMLACFSKLAGSTKPPLTLKDGRLVSEVLGLRENKQAYLLPKQKKEILQVLAKSFLEDPLLNIQKEDRESLLAYLLNPALSPPDWLNARRKSSDQNAKEQAELITLLRGLTTVILPHTLGLSGLMDYGPSIKPGDEVEAPRRQMKPSQCKFELPDIAAALSIQGRLQRGLMIPSEMQKALRYLKDEMIQETKIYQTADKTPSSKAFLDWQKDAREKIRLEDLGPKELCDLNLLNRLIERIGREPKLIELYLSKIVLPAIDIYPYKFTSTAADLTGGCFAAVLFSATLGAAEQYPYISNPQIYFKEDIAFQADVIQRACLPHNRKMVTLTPSTPYQFFVDLFANEPKAFERLDGLLDLGGWSKNFSSLEWALQFMKFAEDYKIPIDGTFFFQEEAAEKGALPEKAMYLLLKGQNTPLRLENTDIKKELSRLGLLKGRFFKIYGPSDTTGTDLVLTENAQMLLTLGEGVTLSSLVQAIMRMRQFLKNPIDPENAQCILWAIPDNLKAVIREALKLDEKTELTPEHCFTWALLQESERQKKAIVMRALQEIQFVVRNRVKQELRNYLKSPEEQIKIFHEHSKAFLLELGRDPFTIYGLGSIEKDAGKVLLEQAEDFAKKANLPLDENPTEEARIMQIINQTKLLIDTISTKASEDLSANAFQHQHQERQQEARQQQQALTEQHAQSTNALQGRRATEPLKYAEEVLSLASSDISKNVSKNHLPVQALFGSKVLASGVEIAQNVFEFLHRTYEESTTFAFEGHHFYTLMVVKPIEYFLLIEDEIEGKSIKKVLAVSIDDAASYQAQLLNENPVGKMKRRVALFSSNGMIAQNGKANFGFSIEELKSFEKDPWFKSVLFDIGLINGQIRDEKKFVELIKKDPEETKTLWDKIVKSHLDQDALQIVLMWHLTKKAESEGIYEQQQPFEPLEVEIKAIETIASTTATSSEIRSTEIGLKVQDLIEPQETTLQPPQQAKPSKPEKITLRGKETIEPVETISKSPESIIRPSETISVNTIRLNAVPPSTPVKSLTSPEPTKLTPWASFKRLWQQKLWAKVLTILTGGIAIPFFLGYYAWQNRQSPAPKI